MRVSPFFLGALLLTGPFLGACSSVAVSDRDEYEGGNIPRPGRILVYDFVVTPADLPAWSEARQHYADAGAKVSADELEAGRKVGAALAEELVKKIDDMGMRAVRATGQPGPQPDDLAIVGYFTSIEAGSAAERIVLGFGKGSADVKVHVSGYRSTSDGMVRLGGGALDSGGGSKAPGVVLPAIVTVATHNPIGLAVNAAVKTEGEVSGRSTDVGSARRVADEIADQLKVKFKEQGWI